MRGQKVIPRARLRAPLWRRVLAWLRSRRITASCAFCGRFAGMSPSVIAMLHESHVMIDRYRALFEQERGPRG